METFGITSCDDVNLFVKMVNEHEVSTLQELKIRANITRCLECSSVAIAFSENLKLEEIEDEVII